MGDRAMFGAAIALLLFGVAASLLLVWLLSLAPSCNERLAVPPHATCWSPSRLVREGDQWLCRCPSSDVRLTREVIE